ARISYFADVSLISRVCWGSPRNFPNVGQKKLVRSKTPIIMVVGETIPTIRYAANDIDAVYFAMKSMIEHSREIFDIIFHPFQDSHHHGGRRTNSYHRGCRERHRRRVLRHEIHDGAGTRALR